jgi:hypothetical protein
MIGQTNGHACNFIVSRILSNIEILKKVKKHAKKVQQKYFFKGNLQEWDAVKMRQKTASILKITKWWK